MKRFFRHVKESYKIIFACICFVILLGFVIYGFMLPPERRHWRELLIGLAGLVGFIGIFTVSGRSKNPVITSIALSLLLGYITLFAAVGGIGTFLTK